MTLLLRLTGIGLLALCAVPLACGSANDSGLRGGMTAGDGLSTGGVPGAGGWIGPSDAGVGGSTSVGTGATGASSNGGTAGSGAAPGSGGSSGRCDSDMECASSERCVDGACMPTCVPVTCATAGAECGRIPDGCGLAIECGDCPSGEVCGGGGANRCGDEPPEPLTCEDVGAECGSISDGVGGTVACGSCEAPETCGGGGVANQCGCTPGVCGDRCGDLADGCGGTLHCDPCECEEDSDCGDGNPCTTDTCTDTGECLRENNTAACSDGLLCTTADRCRDGVCTGTPVDSRCSGAGPCADVRCDPVEGCQTTDLTGDCDDGIACTVNDSCSGGKCSGVPDDASCDDQNPCTTDSCAVVFGRCVNTKRSSGSCQTDCVSDGQCASGVCEGKSACGNGEVCYQDQCCQPTTCEKEGYDCGELDDGCGKTLNCGDAASVCPDCGDSAACCTNAHECGCGITGFLCLSASNSG